MTKRGDLAPGAALAGGPGHLREASLPEQQAALQRAKAEAEAQAAFRVIFEDEGFPD